MAEIFRSFIGGVEAGTQLRENRERRNALHQAGQMYASGDQQGAENALLSAGLTQEAGSYSALAEARRGRQTRESVSQAMTNLDPNATPDARLNAGADAALAAGDTDQWYQFRQAASQMSADQRAQAAEQSQWVGSAAASLLNVPLEQRVQRARELVASSPYANDQALMQAIDDESELTDDALTARANNSMSAADILAGRERQQRYAVQDRQFNQTLAAQRAASGVGGDRPLTNSERIRLSNDYQTNSEQAMSQLGILRPSLPYARLAVSLGGDTTQAQGINFRQSDVALMRAAARAQTGPGVLTESEVFSTLSPSIQQDLIRNVAYADISQSGLTPQDRASLAQFVVQSAQNTERDLWTLHRQATSEWGGVPNAPTFNLPNLPHPDDEGSLQAAERLSAGGQAVLQRGAIRIAPSGREYRYNGPGDWVTTGQGNVEGYQAGREQRLARGGSPTVPTGAASAPTGGVAWSQLPANARQTAIQRVRQNPALMAEFQQTFGLSPEEAQRLVSTSGASNAPSNGIVGH